MSFFDALYPHQKEVIEKTSQNSKGIICLPTGTGKTFCEAAVALKHVLDNPGFSLIVVAAPRIILTYQLLSEFYKCFMSFHQDVRYTFLHSGGPDQSSELESLRLRANAEGANIPFSDIPSHISHVALAEYIQTAKQANLPVIVFSTYHSLEKIEDARKAANCEIDVLLNDEAHYLTQEEFYGVFGLVQARRTYSFTATMQFSTTVNGRGMNNVGLFGPQLVVMRPREAIKAGLMVRPRLHFINTKETYNYDDYQKSIDKIIHESFSHHEKFIHVQPKLLVSVRGTQDMLKFSRSEYYRLLRNDGVEIYMISSHAEIGNDINGQRVKRQEFLRRLKVAGENPEQKILVLHYDILTEGIDVSGFTGILPLRIIGKSKFMQTYGRAARLDPSDRQRIRSGGITPDCLDKMVKPFSYIIIPNITNQDDDYKSNFTSLVTELRDYDFSPFELVLLSEAPRGIPEQVPLDNITDIDKKLPSLGKIITDIISQVESAKIAAMDSLAYLFFAMDED